MQGVLRRSGAPHCKAAPGAGATGAQDPVSQKSGPRQPNQAFSGWAVQHRGGTSLAIISTTCEQGRASALLSSKRSHRAPAQGGGTAPLPSQLQHLWAMLSHKPSCRSTPVCPPSHGEHHHGKEKGDRAVSNPGKNGGRERDPL